MTGIAFQKLNGDKTTLGQILSEFEEFKDEIQKGGDLYFRAKALYPDKDLVFVERNFTIDYTTTSVSKEFNEKLYGVFVITTYIDWTANSNNAYTRSEAILYNENERVQSLNSLVHGDDILTWNNNQLTVECSATRITLLSGASSHKPVKCHVSFVGFLVGGSVPVNTLLTGKTTSYRSYFLDKYDSNGEQVNSAPFPADPIQRFYQFQYWSTESMYMKSVGDTTLAYLVGFRKMQNFSSSLFFPIEKKQELNRLNFTGQDEYIYEADFSKAFNLNVIDSIRVDHVYAGVTINGGLVPDGTVQANTIELTAQGPLHYQLCIEVLGELTTIDGFLVQNQRIVFDEPNIKGLNIFLNT